MRILHVVPTYAPAWRQGGPIHAVHGLCRALAARGHAVTVFTTDRDIGPDLPRATAVGREGVEVWYFPTRPPSRLYRTPSMGQTLAARAREFDLLHLHSVFLWPTWAAARAAARAGVPYILAPRGMLVGSLLRRRGRWRKALWIRWVERRTLAEAAALHVTSALEAQEFSALGLPIPPVVVVPNGVDAFTPAAGELSPAVAEALAHRPYLLFLGRLSWKKGLDRLIRALAEVPEARLVIAGNDEENLRPQLERLAGRLQTSARVHYCGPVAGRDKAALLAAASALVLPSVSENFGNVVLEAMAAGTPAVVTPEVGAAEVLRESGAGLVVPGTPAALARAMRQILGDPEDAADMGRRGALAAQRFSWPAIAERMEREYAAILERDGGRH